MPHVATDLLQSKKFIFVLLVSLAVLGAGHFSLLSHVEVISTLGVLWPVYLGAQGVADIGDKIANGHITREEIALARDDKRSESVTAILTQFIPLFIEKMGGSPPSLTPTVLRSLPKGTRVVRMQDLGNPATVPGEVVEDYPQVDAARLDIPPVKVRFEGKVNVYDRNDIVSVIVAAPSPVASSPTAEA